MVTINYLAVLVSAIAGMVIGGVWYGPLFGKQWIAMMGWAPEKVAEMQAKGAKAMYKSYGLMFVGILLMSWILAHAILFASTFLAWYGAGAGAAVGALNWLGFIAPVLVGTVAWEGRSWKLWTLNAGYYLVVLVSMGIILGAW